jgi:formylglycine-generating enzyme required for sulfatase activity/energy-coupling factor transporter ATP-binding protein EcfA2
MPAAVELAPDLSVRQPYPGLRPFETKEAVLFFGRETHTAELLRRLAEQRFLAVVGSSGSGKSSLVRAGLLPALYRGRLVGATSQWRICVMRPGSAPLDNLAKCLALQQIGAPTLQEVREKVGRSSLGLARAVRDTSLAEGESVLLVVDQFEELFRFANERKEKDGGAEARLFVSSLLEATDASTAPLYVVLTMRSDFLGECTQFVGLPNALNRSQYLIPQLTREQVRDSIEKPARLVGAEINNRLVERLLNELGDDTSDLPVLQHALNRTYLQFLYDGGQGEILVKHYADAGTLSDALDKHANAVLQTLSQAAQPWTEKIFRALTMEEGRRKIRRPTRLDRLYSIVSASDALGQQLVREVVESYAARENSLLVHSEDQVIDISHESLISHWGKLKQWADSEAKAANWYERAADDTVRYAAGEVLTWRGPELSLALENLQSKTWNPAWAERVCNGTPAFEEVNAFVKQGDAEQRQQRAEEESRAAQKLADTEARANAEEQAKKAAEALTNTQRRANRLLLAAGLSIIALVGFALWSQIRMNKLLESQSNALLAGQGDLQAKLGAAAKARVNPEDGLHYVFIPPGDFKMGCSPGDSDCFPDEKPTHDVKISKGFWLGQTDVTQAAWKRVMNIEPSHFKGDQLPVEQVSWDDAVKYCETIGGRLPTEAEWEYAARAGSTSARYGELDAIAWYDKNSGGTTHAVGSKQPNQFGLFDMLGNVYQWTADWYGETYYSPQAVTNPSGPASGQRRVVRGGSWFNNSQFARASNRFRNEPSYRNLIIGFRCVGELR